MKKLIFSLILMTSLMLMVVGGVSAFPNEYDIWQPDSDSGTVEWSTAQANSGDYSAYLQVNYPSNNGEYTSDSNEVYVLPISDIPTLNDLNSMSFWYYRPGNTVGGASEIPPQVDLWLDPGHVGYDTEWLLGQIDLATTYDEWVEVPLEAITWIRATGGHIYGTGSVGLEAAKVDLGDAWVQGFGVMVGSPATRDNDRTEEGKYYIDDIEINTVVYDFELPEITNIDVDPEYPKTTDTVTICADVEDESEIESVELSCDSPYHPFTDRVMEDDGTGNYCTGFFFTTLKDNEEMSCEITATDEFDNSNLVGVDPFTFDGEEPVAEFSCDPLSGDEPLGVKCTSTSHDTVDLDLDHFWEFGDGETSTDQDPLMHTYAEGSYTVSLTVTDDAGYQKTETEEENYIVVSDTNPTANFHYTGSLIEGYKINFYGDTSTSYDGIVSWNWDFDDDTGTIDEQNPEHTFTEDGTYTVSLTVCEADTGCDTHTEDLEILPIIDLGNQEVAAGYELGYTFNTGFSGQVSCGAFDTTLLPEGMTLTGNVDGTCTVNWVPTNEQKGSHENIIVEVSGSGSEYYSFDVTVYSWMIELEEGWNLISIPLAPENTYYQDVLGGLKENLDSICTKIYDIPSDKNDWKCKAISEGEWDGGSLINVEPGRGYWINMKEADTLYGFGNEMYEGEGYKYYPEVALATNTFNLIGHYGLSILIQDNALKSLEGNYMTSIEQFEPEEAYWLWIKIVDGKNSINYAPYYAF